MARARYIFDIATMRVTYQRGKKPDQDFLSLRIDVNGETVGKYTAVPIHDVKSGDFLNFVDGSTDQSTFSIPFEVESDDTVAIIAHVENLSHTDAAQQQGEAIKIATLIDGAIIAVGATIATGGAAVVLAAIAGVVAIIGEIWGWLRGSSDPNCDGVVLADYMTFTGEKLRQLTDVPAGLHAFWKTYDDQPSPDSCGAKPSTELHYRITLSSPGDFGQPAPKPRQLRPVHGGRLQWWDGRWTDKRDILESRIDCTIRANPGGGVSDVIPSGGDAVGTVLARIRELLVKSPAYLARVGADVRALAVRGRPIGRLHEAVADSPKKESVANVSTVAAHMLSGGSLNVHAVERIDPPDGRVYADVKDPAAVPAPMIAWLYTMDRWWYPGSLRSSRVGTALGGGPGNSQRELRMRDFVPAIHAETVAPNHLEFADTVVLANGVSLELFGMFDEHGKMVDQRVRYIRTTTRGDVLMDVMLSRWSPPIR